MQPKPRKLKMVILVAVTGTIIYFGACFVMARGYISPVRFQTLDRPPFLQESFIENGKYDIPVWLTDGWETQKPREDVFILVHGYGGDRSVWNNLAAQIEHSAEVIVPATMGQTESPAKQVGFSVGEAREIIRIAEWTKRKNNSARIHLVGVSMGGSACWTAAGTRPELFASVITEGAFARLDWATEEFLSSSIPWGHKLFWPIPIMASRMSGIKASEVRPVDFAAQWKGPSLVIHGAEDGLFSRRHPDSLSEAVGVESWIVLGAKHAGVSKVELRSYADRILSLCKVKKLAREPGLDQSKT